MGALRRFANWCGDIKDAVVTVAQGMHVTLRYWLKTYDPERKTFTELYEYPELPVPVAPRYRGFHRFDFSVFKEFRTSEKTRLEFRSEFFNLTNHPNFSTPQGPTGGSAVVSAPGALDFKNANFGRITATRDTPNDPRQIQFGLKFYW